MPLVLRKAVFVALCALLLIEPSRAQACTCGEVALRRRIVPADNSTLFPTDGIVRVYLHAYPERVRQAIAREYRLLDEHGVRVPLATTVLRTRVDLRPTEPLRPNTRYTLEQLFAYDDAGGLLSDEQRISATTMGQRMRRAFFAVSTFLTSAGPAARRTVLPRPSGAWLDVAFSSGDCGPGLSVGMQVSLPANALATDAVQLEARTQGTPATIVDTQTSTAELLGFSDQLCAGNPLSFPYRAPIETRVTVLDASGAELGASAWRVVLEESIGNSSALPSYQTLSQAWHASRRGLVTDTTPWREWLLVPVVQAVSAVPPGPVNCRFGLENIQERLVTRGGSTDYNNRSLLSSDGTHLWFAAERNDAPASEIFRIDGNLNTVSVRRTTNTGSQAALLETQRHLYLLSHAQQQPDFPLSLYGFTHTGQPRWHRNFASLITGRTSYESLTAAPNRLLLSFQRVERNVLGWVVLNEQTGEPLVAPAMSALPIAHDSSVSAVWTGEHFLLTWPGEHEQSSFTNTMIVSRDGVASAPQRLSLELSDAIDTVFTGRDIGVVGAFRGRIVWALLNNEGTLLRGPVVVSRGIGQENRKPRIVFHEGLFAMGWETYPSAETYAAVIDRDGNVSPSQRITALAHTATVGIAPVGMRSFVAMVTEGEDALVAVSLRCRSTPPPGPPTQIAP